jgi:phosphoribosylaminoimidazolecarboxamide formyltransferase/IMP cyclohydrolase
VPRALLSVWDKTGIVDLATGLREVGYDILSTGGTASHLRGAGVEVTDVSDVTGFPEMLDGRVKTLHPKVHAALLADRSNPAHMAALREQGIEPIDIVAVNLYPFAETAGGGGDEKKAIEMIDIGGPTLLRAAAKNHESVVAIVDPADYEAVLKELRQTGVVGSETRRRLAQKAFAHTAQYDREIAGYFEPGDASKRFELSYVGGRALRYGENPHQKGVAYVDSAYAGASVLAADVLGGKELSYNNLLDADAAMEACLAFPEPAAVVVKHLTPCGAAVAEDAPKAIRRAIDADPVSAFGGVVGVNRTVGMAEAGVLTVKNQFLEVIVAPHFTRPAREMIENRAGWGKNVRLLELGDRSLEPSRGLRGIRGGLLVQPADALASICLRCATDRKPSGAEEQDLWFAWRIVGFVRSNAIVLAMDGVTVGIGGGQPNRVGSAKIAIEQAGEKAKGAVLASDGFLPFPDTVEVAAEAGVTAIIQPGGSKKDAEVVEAANRLGLTMLVTGIRQFRH